MKSADQNLFPSAVSPRPPGLYRRRKPRQIIAVGGGKGGIGKTMVSTNLSIALSQLGHRVVIMDGDLGGSNVHTALGVGQPKLSLSDFLNRRVSSLADVVVPSGIDNLSLIAGSQDLLEAAQPRHQQKLKILRHLEQLETDYVVIDLGAGTSFNVLDFFVIADHGIIVVLPEPTSIENAYRFIKAAFFRRLQSLESEDSLVADMLEAAAAGAAGAVRTPFELIEAVRKRDPATAQRLTEELNAFRARLVLNQARTPADVEVGNAVVAAWRKFFGLEMSYLGAIGYDDEAWRAVRRRRPLLLERPECNAASGLKSVVDKLLAIDR